MDTVYQGDSLKLLKTLESESVDLVYTDPPFNTGKKQERKTLKMSQSNGGREGFSGKRYDVEELANQHYFDNFDDYYGFLFPILSELYRVLKPTGSLLLHLDWREVHYVRIYLDNIFGRENCLNEIIWHWDYGAKSKSYWPRKHNNILWYAKTDDYFFDISQSDRLPYMAPGLVTKEKAERGKLPTDSWWGSIVGTNSKEKTGYPSQKPDWLLERIILTTSREGDLVLDPFAGSGTTGKIARKCGRRFIVADNNPQAIETMREVFKECSDVEFRNVQ